MIRQIAALGQTASLPVLTSCMTKAGVVLAIGYPPDHAAGIVSSIEG